LVNSGAKKRANIFEKNNFGNVLSPITKGGILGILSFKTQPYKNIRPKRKLKYLYHNKFRLSLLKNEVLRLNN
jgi:hypothetical protein